MVTLVGTGWDRGAWSGGDRSGIAGHRELSLPKFRAL